MTSQKHPLAPTNRTDDDNGNECAICHEAFNVNPESEEEEEEEEPVAGPSTRPAAKRARLMPEVDVAVCGHMFHKFCIYSWFKSGGKVCPLCRKKTTKRGLRRIFNFPSSGPQEGRSYEDEEVEEMIVKLQEEKGKVQGMEETVKELFQKIDDVEGALKGKGEEIEALTERLEGMKKVQRDLEGKLEEKGKEAKKLKERVEALKGIEMELEKMREEFEENEMNGKKKEEDLLKVTKLKEEVEEKLLQEKCERMKREKEMEVKIRDWEAMYKLCTMERDKEMGKAAYFENWCKRFAGIEESSKCDAAELTELMQRKLNGGDPTTTALKTDGATALPVESGHQQQTASKSNFKKESVDLPELEDNDDETSEEEDENDDALFNKLCDQLVLRHPDDDDDE